MRHRIVVGVLALMCAMGAGLVAAATPASAAWSCDASALRGSVLGGPPIEPAATALGASGCRAARVDGASLLPVPLASPALFAQTSLTGPAGSSLGQTAAATGGVADLGLGGLGSLPITLPVEQAIEAVPPVTIAAVPPLVPALSLDLRPQLRTVLDTLQNLELLRLRGAVSYASGRYVGGVPRLEGTSAVAGLTVLGQELPTDRAVTQTLTLLGAQTIDPSTLAVGQLLPAGLPLSPVVANAVQSALDALPPIALPATLAEVRVAPPATTRSADALVQRALGLDVRVAGQPVLELVLGEASLRAAPDVQGTAPSTQAALQCTTRRLVLTDVLRRGSRVRILGAADRRYVGRRVAIVFTGSKRRVARARVRRDGSFATTAPLPRRTLRASNRARYQARVGRERSLRLKLQRRMQVRSLRVSGRRVRISGRVTRPFARPARAIEVRRRESCKRWVVVKRIRPRRDGTFSTTVAAPSGRLAATYRLATRVRKTRRNPKTFPTFTLPRHVDLG